MNAIHAQIISAVISITLASLVASVIVSAIMLNQLSNYYQATEALLDAIVEDYPEVLDTTFEGDEYSDYCTAIKNL